MDKRWVLVANVTDIGKITKQSEDSIEIQEDLDNWNNGQYYQDELSREVY